VRTLLLPGMDGTGTLFTDFARTLSVTHELKPTIVAYPSSQALSYDELLERIESDERTTDASALTIVAESFSGPLGIRLSARLGERVRALVLVATFARSPSWLVAPASLFGSMLFRVPPPRLALRTFLLDHDATNDEVTALERAMRSVAPAVMAKRLMEMRRVDVRADLARVQCPTMYVAGTRDRIVGAAALDVMRAAMPSMIVERLDAPHLVLQRKPIESARAIARFVAESVL
jgi:pimeloyl-[acyl-carrier protein] methyl ester esterase